MAIESSESFEPETLYVVVQEEVEDERILTIYHVPDWNRPHTINVLCRYGRKGLPKIQRKLESEATDDAGVAFGALRKFMEEVGLDTREELSSASGFPMPEAFRAHLLEACVEIDPTFEIKQSAESEEITAPEHSWEEGSYL